MSEELIKPSTKQLEVTTDENGKTRIVFRKANLKGKVERNDVLNALMIAARMQAEKYIEKLSRGVSLDAAEIKSMKELSDIIKLDLKTSDTNVTNNTLTIQQPETLSLVKASIYEAIASRNASKLEEDSTKKEK